MTGISGSGKSQIGNYFIQENVFKTNWGGSKVTTTTASHTGIIKGKHIKIIDTPGFLDSHSLTSTGELKALVEAIVDNPNRVNAIGFTINIQSRLTKEDINLLEKFILMKKMIPYTFLIFTHANRFGNTVTQQNRRLEELLNDPLNCPAILPCLIKKIDNRFMMLESIEPMEEQYFDEKSDELLQILRLITMQNTKPFSDAFNGADKQNKENLVECLVEELNLTMREETLSYTTLSVRLYEGALRDFYAVTSVLAYFISIFLAAINRIKNFFWQ